MSATDQLCAAGNSAMPVHYSLWNRGTNQYQTVCGEKGTLMFTTSLRLVTCVQCVQCLTALGKEQR